MEFCHKIGEIVGRRYQILSVLGRGGIGVTYKALDLLTQQEVALKGLAYKWLRNRKVLELFRREAKVLSQLNHSRIPKYLDYFQSDYSSHLCFYIVQELIFGESLAALVEHEGCFNEERICYIAVQILETLTYLQKLNPPIIHRDIKPQNIIKRYDNQFFLVDFGAVQDVYHQTLTRGSTAIGTYGYMAPEQANGHINLSTDLYGLGNTLIYLLTAKHPTTLPQYESKPDFRSIVRLSKLTSDWLDYMVEPSLSKRFNSAEEALLVLQKTNKIELFPRQLRNTKIEKELNLEINDDCLEINIQAAGAHTPRTRLFGLLLLLTIGFLIILSITIEHIFWLPYFFSRQVPYQVLRVPYPFSEQALFNMFLYPPSFTEQILGIVRFGVFIFSCVLIRFIESLYCHFKINLDFDSFRIQKYFLGFRFQDFRGKTSEIKKVYLENMNSLIGFSSLTLCSFTLKDSNSKKRRKKYCFAIFLSDLEKRQVVFQINSFLFKTGFLKND